MSKAQMSERNEYKPIAKSHQTVIQRLRQLTQVKPDIKRRNRRDSNFQSHLLQASKDAVPLHKEMLLESDTLLLDVLWVQKR